MSDRSPELPAYLRSLLELHPAYLTQGKRRRDLAYACYLYFGVMLAIAFVLNVVPTDSRLYGFIADYFGATVLFGFVPAGLLGVGSSLFLRDPPLLVLAALTAGVPVVLWTAGWWPFVAGVGGGLFFTALAVLALVLPLRWFFGVRRRLIEAERRVLAPRRDG